MLAKLGITRKTLNNILCRFRRHGDVMSILTREQSLIPIEYFLRHPSAYLRFKVRFLTKSKSGFLNLKAHFEGVFFSFFFFTKIQKRIINPKNLHFEWILQFKSKSRFLRFMIQAYPDGITTLPWWDSLCVSRTPRAMSAGVLYSW